MFFAKTYSGIRFRDWIAINFLVISGAVLVGCAAPADGPRIENGTAIGRFYLQDVSDAILREHRQGPLSAQYTLGLANVGKVVNLGTAEQMRLEKAFQIQDRTVAVFRKKVNGCVMTSVVSIRRTEISHWSINDTDCRSEPILELRGDKLYLWSVKSPHHLYENGNFYELTVETPNRVAAPAPDKTGVASQKRSGSSPAVRPQPKNLPSSSTSSPHQVKPIEFRKETENPVRINMGIN